jgi:hypothetical protein
MRLSNDVTDIDADTEAKAPVVSVSDRKFTNTGLE